MGGLNAFRLRDLDNDGPDSMTTGSPNVITNSRPQTRVRDLDNDGPDSMVTGSGTVITNGRPTCRMKDTDSDGDTGITGSPNVFIGEGIFPVFVTPLIDIPPDVLKKEEEKVADYTANPTKYSGGSSDGQQKPYYNTTLDTPEAKVTTPPPPLYPAPETPTPNKTGNKWTFVGGNQSVKAMTNNPSGGGVTKSWPSGWTKDKGGIVKVIRPKNSAAVLPFLSQCLSENQYWMETGMGGKTSNPKITNMWKSLGVGSTGMWANDQTAWCAGYVNYTLQQSGLKWLPQPGAKQTVASAAQLNAVEVAIDDMQPGDIALWSYSHVNFVYERFA